MSKVREKKLIKDLERELEYLSDNYDRGSKRWDNFPIEASVYGSFLVMQTVFDRNEYTNSRDLVYNHKLNDLNKGLEGTLDKIKNLIDELMYVSDPVNVAKEELRKRPKGKNKFIKMSFGSLFDEFAKSINHCIDGDHLSKIEMYDLRLTFIKIKFGIRDGLSIFFLAETLKESLRVCNYFMTVDEKSESFINHMDNLIDMTDAIVLRQLNNERNKVDIAAIYLSGRKTYKSSGTGGFDADRLLEFAVWDKILF